MGPRQAVAWIEDRWLRLGPNVRGALWVLAAGLLASAMGAGIKLLGQAMDPLQLAFIRAGFGLLTVLPFMLRAGVGSLRTRHPLGHLWRGGFGALSMICGYYALAHLPLAEVTALNFTNALFLVLLAALWLGETVRLRRALATVVGFAGVLIMLRPGAGIEFAALVIVFGAFCTALAMVALKQLLATEARVTVMFYFSVATTVISLPPALFVWQTPEWHVLVALMFIGALGAWSQSLLMRGFAIAEASAVAPFDYARLPFTGALGYFMFGDVPTGWTLLGAAIIVGSTFYIARHEAQNARRAAATDRPPPA